MVPLRVVNEENMIFRQMFDDVSSTYTYLLASRRGGEALIIDPVLGRVDHYVKLLGELNLKLVKAVDTHVHADHITGLGALRDRTRCITVMGENSGVDVVSMRVTDGDHINIEGIALEAIYTPGHTDDSYCFHAVDRVFTGDTLLIRGTGRTDFQNGDPHAQYNSLFNKLLKLPEETLVYPAHDYKGDTVSTIGEEVTYNPRLQVSSADEYAEIMNNLNLPNPKMMNVAVPANLRIGLLQDDLDKRGCSLTCEEAQELLRSDYVTLVDIREQAERDRHGVIPGAIHAPYGALDEYVKPGGILNELMKLTGKWLVFYCAYGERSAMAVEAALGAGFSDARHIRGGIDCWKKENGPITM